MSRSFQMIMKSKEICLESQFIKFLLKGVFELLLLLSFCQDVCHARLLANNSSFSIPHFNLHGQALTLSQPFLTFHHYALLVVVLIRAY